MSDLDERCSAASRHWRLRLGDRLMGGTQSAVFSATDAQGRDLVLKLPAAQAGNDVAAAEAAALRAWAGSGAAVTLVDSTADALLLVRARPGRLMSWQPADRTVDTVAVTGELLRRLWCSPPGGYRYPTLAEVYPENERVARQDAAFEQRQRGEPCRGELGLARLPCAAAVAEQLISTAPAWTLLHGDFISKNLVSDTAGPVGWVAIDPLPMIGEAAAEVAAFAAYHPAEAILPTAEALAREVGIEPGRVLAWTAIWCVHQAAQAWRDDQAELDGLITSTAIGTLLKT
ncbi:MAG: aminoglycoside phosphotransferase family protein [Microlunatus sp.]